MPVWAKSYKDPVSKNKPSVVVVHACNPSYVRGRVRRIINQGWLILDRK
jgi:hypothetical protein